VALREQIETDLKQAMRDKDTLARETLRMVLADLKNKRIELGRDLDESDELGVLRRAVKTRQDSVEQYSKAGRTDLADKEAAEIRVLEGYLPRTLNEAQTRELVGDLVRELGISSKKDVGVLMKAIMARHKGEVEGKLVQKVASELLA
jgi:hypothetical protein